MRDKVIVISASEMRASAESQANRVQRVLEISPSVNLVDEAERQRVLKEGEELAAKLVEKYRHTAERQE